MTKAPHDSLHPAVPAGAYDDLLARVLPKARAQRVWEPGDGRLRRCSLATVPRPPSMTRDGLTTCSLGRKPCPSPRRSWSSLHTGKTPRWPSLAASPAHLLYDDFGGYHPRYYTLQYRTPDATALAGRIAGTFSGTTQVHHHASRGLDHGAFIPLMAMYPAADVPVIQLSMPSLDAAALLALGQRLRPLRDEGVLVVGSGFMTHSFAAARNPALAGYTEAFDAWAADALAREDIDALTDFRTKAPGAAIAHPTAEHYVPLLLTLGAASTPGARPVTAIERMVAANSIRSIQVD